MVWENARIKIIQKRSLQPVFAYKIYKMNGFWTVKLSLKLPNIVRLENGSTPWDPCPIQKLNLYIKAASISQEDVKSREPNLKPIYARIDFFGIIENYLLKYLYTNNCIRKYMHPA